MKNPFKILGIIALSMITGFSMTACPHDAVSPPPMPEKFIIITDIDPTYNGMIGALKLYLPGSSVAAVYSSEEKIINNSVTLPLYNWAGEDPWLGSGSFSITIFIFENRSAAAQKPPITKYKGSITEIAITEATTTIAWGMFL